MSVSRVGLVGCGYWGKNLVRNFYELGALRAICDVDSSRVMSMAGTYGVLGTTTFTDLLDDPDIDAIAIAAPAAEHYALGKRALLAGKDIFVEKPLALHVEEGEELIELAAKHNRLVMVGHLLHYHPAVTELKKLITAGELGRIQYIYSSRLNLGKVRMEENILWSFAPHDISTILLLLDEFPVQVAAHGSSYLHQHVCDITVSNLEFASGTKANIFVSWLHPYKEQRLVIVGDRKMAVFDDTEQERKLVLYPHRIDWINRVPVAHKAEGEVVPVNPAEPLKLECAHFLDAVANRTKPKTDGENGLQVLRILHACDQSIKGNGQPISLQTSAPAYFVHPTAVVDFGAEIGQGSRIWHFAHIMDHSILGRNCNIGQNVHVASGVKIGNNVKIQNNVSVYSGVEMEDDVFCGPSMVFTNVSTPRSHINRKAHYERTLVKRGATLGANSTIVCGVTIGEYAFIGAGAVVTRDVADHALVLGVPARQVGWVCQCGVTLGMNGNTASCTDCGTAYVISEGKLFQYRLAQSAG
jgi:UDP-2-acetamido-3-amino-2,3-dideoxy-glucuronate N-acetyltransferase